MKLTKESEYGLDGLAHLARQGPGRIVLLRDIATTRGLPERFLAKTFQKLTRSGLLRSHRGKKRGYALSRPSSRITVREVLEAIEGPDIFIRCVFWNNTCTDEHPCLLHGMWKAVRPAVVEALTQVTLEDVAARRPAKRPRRRA